MTRDNGDASFHLTKGIVIIAAVFVLFFGLLSYLFVHYDTDLDYGTFPGINASDRILIFAPHPDDESLGTGAIISRASQMNIPVKVVVMTDGSGSHTKKAYESFLEQKNLTNSSNLPEMRYQEFLNATQSLGLSISDIIALGYPDGGLKPLYEDYWDQPFQATSEFNNFTSSPYNFSYQKNVTYTGANVENNVETIIRDFKPTIIFYPDDGDDHTDHWATSAFVRYASVQVNYTGKNYTYLVHKSNKWPQPEYYVPNAQLRPPTELLSLDSQWLISDIDIDERSSKETAINSHATQIFQWKNYLQSFIRVNEVFAIYPDIIIQREEGNDFLFQTMPASSFTDYHLDAKTMTLKPADDLTALGMSYDDQNVYLFLQTSQKLKTELNHNFHLRMFDGQSYRRMDINVKDNKASYVIKANNSIQGDQPPQVDIMGDIMVVRIPITLFKNVDEVMLNADVYDVEGKSQVDIMAWRNLKFPDNVLDEILNL